MNKAILVTAAASAAIVLAACTSANNSATSGMTKEQRKAYYAYQDSVTAVAAMDAVANQRYVAAADRVDNLGRGQTVSADKSTNYVSLNGTEATIQISSKLPILGQNGLGGVTLSGTATAIKTTYDKRGNITQIFRVIGGSLSAEVTLRMAKGSDRAIVDVSGTFGQRDLTLQCQVMPYNEAFIVKGKAI